MFTDLLVTYADERELLFVPRSQGCSFNITGLFFPSKVHLLLIWAFCLQRKRYKTSVFPFQSSFYSTAALLSHCFATALFTLFKILPPSASPDNILSFLPFLSPDRFSSVNLVRLFFCPLLFPTLSQPSNPHTSFSPVSLLLSAPVFSRLSWHSGRRRRSEGAASCISYMHYSCALQLVWLFCWLFTGTLGLVNELCTVNRAWWKSCTDGTANSSTPFVTF